MKIGKILLMVMLIVGFMTLVGCGKKAEEKAPAMVEKTEEAVAPAEQQEETQPTKAWTDDDFVEFWALMTYLGALTAEEGVSPAELIREQSRIGNELEKLYKKFGMTDEQFGERLVAWQNEWAKKALSDPEKAGKEYEKLMERMQKRVEELRKGK